MLGTVYFRCFAEYDRPAIADEKVRCDTEGGIRCYRRVTIGSSTLECHFQLANGHPFARVSVDLRQHVRYAFDDRLDCLARSVVRLDRHGLQMIVGFQSICGHEVSGLIDFATKANDQDGCEVRMPRVPVQGALQDLDSYAVTRHATSCRVNHRHHTVNPGEVVE